MEINNAGEKVFQSSLNADSSKAVLYLYRPEAFGSALASPLILIGKKESVILENGGYTKVPLAPGNYVIETAFNSAWVYGKKEGYKIVLEGGRNYFVQVSAKAVIVPTWNPITCFFDLGTQFKLTQMDESVAMDQIQKLHYLEPATKTI